MPRATLPTMPLTIEPVLPERARGGLLGATFAAATTAHSPASAEHWITVPLNWSKPSGAKQFDVRYFTDDSHFVASNVSAPIFVTMGGEGTSRGARCSSLAIKHSALCVAVEHRFYGQSVPRDGGASNANYWEGLSVEQNLADTAAIVKRLQKQYAVNGAQARPVISFGGSYSGATCAWFRARYPEVTMACVSSSGVVDARLDFPQFDEHVSRAIGDDCASKLAAAYGAIDAAFDRGDGARIKEAFNATNLIGTAQGDNDFMYALADGPAMMDQYGAKADLCNSLGALPPNPTDDQRIANLAAIISRHYGTSFAADCFYDSECVKNTTAPQGPSALGGLNSRSWRFQKCSEVAYLQRRPDPREARGRGAARVLRSKRLTLDALLSQCEYIFGAGTNARQKVRNDALNRKFGSARPVTGRFPASDVFYLDFSDDPWAEVSVQSQLGPRLPYCYTQCDGCGHCGAGVPPTQRACMDKADAWVDSLLARARARNR